MKIHCRFIPPTCNVVLQRAALLALGPAVSALLGCASEGVDLGGGTVAQELRRGSRCAESPIIDGDVLVREQADVAALEGCQEIRGDLTIQLFASADLSPLHQLQVVEGTLAIGQEAASVAFAADDFDPQLVEALAEQDAELLASGWLESLTGLEALERVGALFLEGTSVTDLSALEQLRVIGGQVARATGVLGLGTGSLMLVSNRELVDLSGLENARGVDALFIVESPSLVSLAGLVLEQEITAVNLSQAPALVELSALSSVLGLTTLSLSGLGITDLSALSSLERAELLTIASNPALVDVSALSNLERSGSVGFVDNAALRQLPSFNRWFGVPGDIVILDNPVLETVALDFGGFADSRDVDGTTRVFPADVVHIENNALLSSVTIPAAGLSEGAGLTSADFFLLRNNPSLSSVDFGALRRAGLLSIADNASLDSITLGALARVEDLEVTNNPELPAAAFDGVATFERTLSGNLP